MVLGALLAWTAAGRAGDGGLVRELEAVIRDAGPRAPDLAAVCQPSGELLEHLGTLFTLMAFAGEDVPAGAVRAVTSVDAIRAAGLDAEGSVSMGLYLDEREGWLKLPLSAPDAATAERLMGALNIGYVADGEGWSVEGGKARAALSGADLVVRKGDGSTGAIFDGSILNGMPSGSGCVLWGADRPGLGLPAPADETFQMSLFVPFDGADDALMHIKLTDPAPAVLSRPQSAPVGGTTSEAPSVVLAAGVSLAAFLEDPGVLRALEMRPREARRVVRALDIGPGTTAAFFGAVDPDRLDWVLVLPVNEASTRRIARKGRRVLREMGLRVRRGGPDGLIAQGDASLVFGFADPGRLVLGVDPSRVMEVASRTGTSWLVGADEARLGSWPLVGWTGAGIQEAMGLPEGARLDLSLRAADGVWELGLHAEGLGEALLRVLEEEVRSSDP